MLYAPSLVGWRHALLVVVPTAGQLTPVFSATSHVLHFGRSAEAVCVFHPHHRPPQLACGCGFYALKDRAAIVSGRYSGGRRVLPAVHKALLNVSLSGTVVEGVKGFRAARQHVLSAHFSANCARCATHRVSRFSVLTDDSLGLYPEFPLAPTCDRCGSKASEAFSVRDVEYALGVPFYFESELAWTTPLPPRTFVPRLVPRSIA